MNKYDCELQLQRQSVSQQRQRPSGVERAADWFLGARFPLLRQAFSNEISVCSVEASEIGTVVPAVRRFRRVRLAAAAGEVRGKAQQICEKRL